MALRDHHTLSNNRFYSSKTRTYQYFALTIGLYIIWEGFQLGVPVWLEYWARVVDTTSHSLYYFLSVYAALVLTYMIVDVYLTYVCNVHASVNASKTLHEKLLARVLRLPMSFFDVTP